MSLLPNIEVVQRNRVVEQDGRTDELKPDETPSSGAETVGFNYFLEVRAVNRNIAERKAKNFLRAKHPADALNVMIESIYEEGEDGLFSEAGPQNTFSVDASILK